MKIPSGLSLVGPMPLEIANAISGIKVPEILRISREANFASAKIRTKFGIIADTKNGINSQKGKV